MASAIVDARPVSAAWRRVRLDRRPRLAQVRSSSPRARAPPARWWSSSASSVRCGIVGAPRRTSEENQAGRSRRRRRRRQPAAAAAVASVVETVVDRFACRRRRRRPRRRLRRLRRRRGACRLGRRRRGRRRRAAAARGAASTSQRDRNERPVGAASDRNERPVRAARRSHRAAGGRASDRNERPVGAAAGRWPHSGRSEAVLQTARGERLETSGQGAATDRKRTFSRAAATSGRWPTRRTATSGRWARRRDATLLEVERVEMRSCARHCAAFAAARLDAHMRRAKVPKQREAFDPSKQRLAGTGAEEVRRTSCAADAGGGSCACIAAARRWCAIPKWERESAWRPAGDGVQPRARGGEGGGRRHREDAAAARDVRRGRAPCRMPALLPQICVPRLSERHEPVCGKNPNRRR